MSLGNFEQEYRPVPRRPLCLLPRGPPFGEPEAGDQIVTDGTIFEVMSLGSQGHWRWSDPHRQALRIHAKETGAE